VLATRTVRLLRLCVLSVPFGTHSSTAWGGEVVRDAKLNMSVTLPEGVFPVPDEARLPGFTHCFARNPDQPGNAILICIRGVGATLASNRIPAQDLAKMRDRYPGAERFSVEWRSIPVEGFTFVMTDNGFRAVNYHMVIPTQPEAIQIIASGATSQDPEVRGYLNSVLRTLEATPSSSSTPKHLVIRVWHLVLVTLVVLAVVYCRRGSRRGVIAPPATQDGRSNEQSGDAPTGG
jgi:hypothetical protein